MDAEPIFEALLCGPDCVRDVAADCLDGAVLTRLACSRRSEVRYAVACHAKTPETALRYLLDTDSHGGVLAEAAARLTERAALQGP